MGLCAVLLIVLGVPMPPFVSNTLHVFATPLWSTKSSLTSVVVNAYEALDSKDALVRENVALHEELSMLRRESFNTRLLRIENERLEALVGRNDDTPSVVATVLTTETMMPFDVFVIDVGLDRGLTAGDLVVSGEGFAMGSVSRVLERSATVTLFSSAGFKTPVLLGATTTLRATATGRGSGTFAVDLPRDVALVVGDPVTLQTFAVHPVGEVAAIETEPTGSLQRVLFRAPLSLSTTRKVVIIPQTQWRPADMTSDDASALAPTPALNVLPSTP